MMMSWKASSLAIASMALLALSSPSAFADIAMFDLNVGNVGGLACCTGPYAQVTIDLTSSTTATVTFDSLDNGGFLYLIGANQGAGINVNGTATSTGFSGSNSVAGFTPGTLSDGGSTQFDGFGLFSNSVSVSDGFKSTYTEISFTLTATGATTWSSAANVLSPNSNGNSLAVHGFACADPCSVTEGAFATGFASQIPEPKTLPLLLVGMGGLVAAAFRLRKRNNTI